MAGEHKYNNTVVELYSDFKYDDKQMHFMSWNMFLSIDTAHSA